MLDDRDTNLILFCSKTILLKVISVITMWFFLLTTGVGGVFIETVWAARTPSGIDADVSSVDDNRSFLKEFDVETVILPQNLGSIKYTHRADSDKTVIHIQDAHCNYAAQHVIADIIEYFHKEYGINVVNLEGGQKAYDLSIFAGIYDKNIREKVADFFVKEGIVNGGEFFAINNPEKLTLWGVENVGLYLRNLDVYRNSLGYKDIVEKYIKSLSHILGSLKLHIYSEELLDLDQRYHQYKVNNAEFKEYLSYILSKGTLQKIDIKAFENLYLLNQSLEAEKEIDFKKADIERRRVMDILEERLSDRELKKFVLKTIEYKMKKISQEDFYKYLVKKAKLSGIDLEEFPEFKRYMAYISTYHSVNKEKVMEELNTLENEIKESLYENDAQRELGLLSKNFALIKNIFNFTLTKDDYEYYRKNSRLFNMSNYTSFINEKAHFIR